jgi:hypothetical protein
MGRARCKWFKSIDVRDWHRQGLFTLPGKVFACNWTCDGKPSGSISVFVRDGSATLALSAGPKRSTDRATRLFRLDTPKVRWAQAMVSLPVLYSPGCSPLPPGRELGLPGLLRSSVGTGVEGVSRSDEGAEDPGAVGRRSVGLRISGQGARHALAHI